MSFAPFLGFRAFVRSTAGAVAAEFALVLPLFLITVFGTINMGFAMSAITRLHFAAEKSARCLSVTTLTTTCKANIDTYAKGIYQIGGMSSLAFVAVDDPVCGNKVTGTGTYTVFTGVGQIDIPVSASACYPKV